MAQRLVQRLRLVSAFGKASDGGITEYQIRAELTRTGKYTWTFTACIEGTSSSNYRFKREIPLGQVISADGTVEMAKHNALAVLSEKAGQFLRIEPRRLYFANMETWTDHSD